MLTVLAPFVLTFLSIKAIIAAVQNRGSVPKPIIIKPTQCLAARLEEETGICAKRARLKASVERDVKLLHLKATYRFMQPECIAQALMQQRAEIPLVVILPDKQMIGKAVVIDGNYQRLCIPKRRAKKAAKVPTNKISVAKMPDPALQNPTPEKVEDPTPTLVAEQTPASVLANVESMANELYEPARMNWTPVATRWVHENQKQLEAKAQDALSRNEDMIVIPAYELPDMQAWSAVCETLTDELGLSDVEMEETLIRARINN